MRISTKENGAIAFFPANCMAVDNIFLCEKNKEMAPPHVLMPMALLLTIWLLGQWHSQDVVVVEAFKGCDMERGVPSPRGRVWGGELCPPQKISRFFCV